MKSTKFGRDTSACRCISYRSHVTQMASDFPNKLPPRESRVPETFIDTLLCIHGHTPRGYNGPTWSSSQPLFRLFAPPAARARTPTLCSLRHYFPESVYYHRPVSSFMQNNLISRASKSRYNAALYNVFCSLLLAPRRQLPRSAFPFLKSIRENCCNNLQHLVTRVVSSAAYTFFYTLLIFTIVDNSFPSSKN